MKAALTTTLAVLIGFVAQAQRTYDLQGHRGARGLMPENTIPAMVKALELGVTTLELDLVITKDEQVLVSHDPWMNGMICLSPDGAEIGDKDRSYNIYEMTYQEVRKYDCGSKQHASFPDQLNFMTGKPLLRDLIASVEKYVETHGLPKPSYNIEIKSTQEGDDTFHPRPEEFSELVYAVVSETIEADRIIIQSFDFRVLRFFHDTYPEVKLAMLVTDPTAYKAQLADLGFQPRIYSPYFYGLTKEIVHTLQQKGMEVIPWTVNEKEQMEKLLAMGVNGIITDYPNLAPQ